MNIAHNFQATNSFKPSFLHQILLHSSGLPLILTTTTKCRKKELTAILCSSIIPTATGIIRFDVAVQDEALKISKLEQEKYTLEQLVSHRTAYADVLLIMDGGANPRFLSY